MIVSIDKANLGIFWFKDEFLEDTANLPLAADIVASLEVALKEFRTVEDALQQLDK